MWRSENRKHQWCKFYKARSSRWNRKCWPCNNSCWSCYFTSYRSYNRSSYRKTYGRRKQRADEHHRMWKCNPWNISVKESCLRKLKRGRKSICRWVCRIPRLCSWQNRTSCKERKLHWCSSRRILRMGCRARKLQGRDSRNQRNDSCRWLNGIHWA